MSNDREKALDVALAAIDKQFGKGSIMRMGEKGSMAIEAIQTGALALDVALGVGGGHLSRLGLVIRRAHTIFAFRLGPQLQIHDSVICDDCAVGHTGLSASAT